MLMRSEVVSSPEDLRHSSRRLEKMAYKGDERLYCVLNGNLLERRL
jgi:hypothetical protein